jgi:hypothetical protein
MPRHPSIVPAVSLPPSLLNHNTYYMTQQLRAVVALDCISMPGVIEKTAPQLRSMPRMPTLFSGWI